MTAPGGPGVRSGPDGWVSVPPSYAANAAAVRVLREYLPSEPEYPTTLLALIVRDVLDAMLEEDGRA